MKKINVCLSIFILLLHLSPISAIASPSTSETFGEDARGEFVRTQDAVTPGAVISNLDLSNPQDIFIDENDVMFIADAGNARILLYDIMSGQVLKEMTHPEFRHPQGIFVTEEGYIYVTDSGAASIFLLNPAGELIESFGRPTAPIFGDTIFRPRRIAVDNAGNMFVISEAVFHGVIQLTSEGEFLGYFTTNRTRLTFEQMLHNFIFSWFEDGTIITETPSTFSNIHIDHRGILYTTTSGTTVAGMRKHNTAGGNIFPFDVVTGNASVDVVTNSEGIIFVADESGRITVISRDGQIIFHFGESPQNADVVGLFRSLSSIALDSQNRIWGLDSSTGFIHSHVLTDYALKIFNALTLFDQGHYEEAIDEWADILRFNQMAIIAHNGIGRSYMFTQDFERAIHHFEIAGNRDGYSQAFWELRNIWIQQHAGIIVLIILVLVITSFLIKMIRKMLFKNRPETIPINRKFIFEDTNFSLVKKAAFHPIDTFYDIRIAKVGSYISATVIYILTFVAFVLNMVASGFIYRTQSIREMNFPAVTIGYVGVIVFFTVGNYLISTIQDGQGTWRKIYFTIAYSLGPFTVSLVATTILSHVLTFNEAFVLTFIMVIGTSWSIIIGMVGLKEIHDYDLSQLAKNLFFTLMIILIALIVIIVVTVMSDRTFQFLQALREELWQFVTQN